MKETSKAMRRRRCEEASGGFKWSKILTGKGVDIGAGDDPLHLPECRPFDVGDGDANHLSRYIPAESLDYIHASQCLEHMHDPRGALLDWATCVKKGGYLVFSTPDYDLYDKCIWPSRFNPDHKSAWSMWRRADRNCPVLIHLPTFLKNLERHGLATVISRLVDTNYDYLAADSIDQSVPDDGAEMWLEVVLKKQ